MLTKSLSITSSILAVSNLVGALPAERHLKRQDYPSIPTLACGHYSTVDSGNSQQNIGNLADKDEDVTVTANTCGRIGIINTSAVYVCNDQPADITINIQDAARYAQDIADYCGYTPDSQGGTSGDYSGQLFVQDSYGYNVVVAYGNGNDDSVINPSDYTPFGPNGDPFKTCGLAGSTSCEWGTCDPDSIVVDGATSETCGEFLGPDYTITGNTLQYSTVQSETTGWSVGGFVLFNFADLAAPMGSAGVSFTYTDTTTSGYSTGVSAMCGDTPGGTWTCGLDITPKCVITTGTCHATNPSTGSDFGIQPFTASLPQTTETDDGTSLSVFGEYICVCRNCEGWADNGAPQTACGLDCATCLDGALD